MTFSQKKEWEATLNKELPKLSELIEFLNKRTQLLEALNVSDQVHIRNHYQPKSKPRGNQSNKLTSCNASVTMDKKFTIQCFLCKGSHALYQCSDFLNLSVAERINKIRDLKLCLNCMKSKHSAENCKANSCRYIPSIPDYI